MDLFKGVGLLTERWVKGKLKVIASELGIPYSGKFSKYVLIDKFHYHLIEYLYGVPHPDLAKYDSPSRALNFVNLIKDLDKDKKSPLYIYMHYHTSGNAFSKRVIEKVKAEAEARELALGNTEENRSKAHFYEAVKLVIVDNDYKGIAIVKEIDGIPYLDKFAVAPEHQSNGVGKRIWSQLKEECPSVIWRASETNPINGWYQLKSDGNQKTGKWIVFWCGNATPELIDRVACREESFWVQ